MTIKGLFLIGLLLAEAFFIFCAVMVLKSKISKIISMYKGEK